MKRRVYLPVLILALALTTGCKKEEPQIIIAHDGDTLEISAAKKEKDEIPLKPVCSENPNDGVVCLLLGYEFNTEEFINGEFQKLVSYYGLEKDGGILCPFVYPDDFKKGKSARISELNNLLKGKNINGLILLGAPENTNTAIATLQDYWLQKIPYPIYAFFPQDDALGMEAVCDFILEYERNEAENLEQTENVIGQEFYGILKNSIDYILKLPHPLPKDKNLHTHVNSIAGRTNRYVDSETGLQSINHFVMKKSEK